MWEGGMAHQRKQFPTRRDCWSTANGFPWSWRSSEGGLRRGGRGGDGSGEVVCLVGVDFRFLRQRRTTTGGGGGFGYHRRARFIATKWEPKVSDDAPGRGEKDRGLSGVRGNSTASESAEVDGDVCGLRLQNCTAWRLGSWRGKGEGREESCGFAGVETLGWLRFWGSRGEGVCTPVAKRRGGAVRGMRSTWQAGPACQRKKKVRERESAGGFLGWLTRVSPVRLLHFFFCSEFFFQFSILHFDCLKMQTRLNWKKIKFCKLLNKVPMCIETHKP
jgi:hypothetical protein